MGTTFPSDKAEVKILNELGADAIVAVTIDCEMSWEDGALSPRMSVRMTGGTNGWKIGPTTFIQGVISGPGVSIEDARENAIGTVEQLKTIMRVEDLISQLGNSIEALKMQESSGAYDKLWDLR